MVNGLWTMIFFLLGIYFLVRVLRSESENLCLSGGKLLCLDVYVWVNAPKSCMAFWQIQMFEVDKRFYNHQRVQLVVLDSTMITDMASDCFIDPTNHGLCQL